MSLNLILGKAKTGKSSYIYSCIEEDIKSGIKPILFVPSQTRLICEDDYINFLNKPGIIGVNITTISTFIEQVLKSNNLHYDENFVSKLDKKIILDKVILENETLFKTFKNVKSKSGFLDLLNIYMDIFRKENIDIEKLNNVNNVDKLTKLRLQELTQIYEKYTEKLNSEYIDNIDEINLFISYFQNEDMSKLISNTNIYFDGYNNFSVNEFKIIEMSLKLGAKITISLCTDITCKEDVYSFNTQSIFEVANKTYLNILNLCNKVGIGLNTKIMYNHCLKNSDDIQFLVDNLFCDEIIKYNKEPEHIHIRLKSNVYTQIEYIASVINQKLKLGYKYKDFVIYTTDIDEYSEIISRIFYDFKIPVHINNKYQIKNSKIVRYIYNILEMAINSLDIDTVISTLKLGLNDIVDEDIFEFENYILEFNINKYSLDSKFKINNYKKNEKIYDLDKLNLIREKILDIFGIVHKLKKSNTVNNYIKILYEHLSEYNILYNYEQFLEFESKVDSVYCIGNSSLETQVISKIWDILDSIDKIYKKEEITVNKFSSLFNMCVNDTVVKTIDPTLDQVSVLDINVDKVSVKKDMFFIGVNDEKFPKKVEQDILFTDNDLDKFKEAGVELKQTCISKTNMYLYNIYEAMSNCKENLYLIIPSADISGKSLRISPIINNVKEIINVKIVGDVIKLDSNIDIYNSYSKEELFEYIVETINKLDKLEELDIKEIENILAIYEYLKSDKVYSKIIDYIKSDSNLDKKSIDMLYNKLSTSVSRLELFSKCPFSYYMKYCLKLEPRKKFKILALDTGSFMHSVLESFSKHLLRTNVAWHEILVDATYLEEKYVKILETIIESELDSNLGKHKESIKYNILKQKLTNTMKKVILVLAKGFNQSEFVPFGYEIEFKEDGIFTPIIINLDNGKQMKLIGKIDRVDIAKYEDNLYVRVIDYKSSSKDLKLDDIKEGLSIQLITYLTAFIKNIEENDKLKKELINKNEIENINKIVPAGMLYFNLSSNLVNLLDYTNDVEKIESECIKALRMKGIFLKDAKVIELMDKKIDDTKLRMVDISKSTIVSAKASKKALEEKEFQGLCDDVQNIIKNIGEEIVSGVVKIRPNKKADYCKYCEFSNICRKDSCV